MQTDWSLFFGRFHPLIVHLPIGFIVFAALLSLTEIYKRNNVLTASINIALLAGTASAILAAISGYLLSSGGGYNINTLGWHKWLGFGVIALTFLAWLVRIRVNSHKKFFKLNLNNIILSACLILIAISGHLGGNMTHGEGYLTRHMPQFFQQMYGSAKAVHQKITLPVLDSVIVYNDIIQPIFDAKCTSCHNPDKLKGNLNLTTEAGIMEGGKSGHAVVAGDLAKSELYRRITLPPGSSKFMPTDNHPPLIPIETGFIKWWITSGVEFRKNLLAMGIDEKTKFLVSNYLGIDVEAEKEILLPKVAAADSIVIRQLTDMKIIVSSVTTQSNLLEASFVMVQKSSPEQQVVLLEKLSAIKVQLYRLDVSNCKLNRQALNIISGFIRLNKLDMQKNNLTDDMIQPLVALQQLVVLNSGQNTLTDKSIVIFKKMPALKKINLWQNIVTEVGIKNLESANIVVEH